jgi:hypothetical protein
LVALRTILCRVGLALGLGIALATFLLYVCAHYVWWEYTSAQHRPAYHSMELAILGLAEKCPANLTDEEWALCICCTWNLHSNYGGKDNIPAAELERLAAELRIKTSEGATLETIDWFWDEYARSAPQAASYNRWRPTSPASLASAPRGDYECSLKWWRSEYHRRSSVAVRRLPKRPQ